MNMRNTKKKGKFTLFVYPEKPNYYVGVCLEFDLIQEGKSPIETMERIKEATINYLKTVIEFNMSDDLLNQPAPMKYWEKYRKLLKKETEATKERAKGIPWEEFLQEQIYNPEFLKRLANAKK